MKLNRGRMMRKENKGKKRITEKQTQGFGECGEVGVGEGKGGDLSDGNELFGDGGGEHRKWSLQGNGERGFWKRKEEKIINNNNWKKQRKAHLW